MKDEDLILLGLVAVSVFAVFKMFPKRAAAAPAPAGNTYGATEIMRDNGWTYYSDGTAIGPDGRYYYQGAEVYNPRGMYS